ncbi:RidA family protein [Phenylobacterium sp.]|jgi:enamine deaminase RidA (YjgF/YER057c/UK114 family)|uniref:RidA family protein n=1 Tax=Phenylobacterium sp. TaxID=1871053 RepID=UPI002F91FC9F
MKLRLAALVLLALAAPAAAQPASAPAVTGYPKTVPAPGGAVVIPTAGAQRAYDQLHYAPARRAGDYLYVSGVIAGPAPDEKRDAEAFKAQARRAFAHLRRTLEAGGASFADVVMINTFHVWDGPGFQGTRDEQFAAFGAVKDEFMTAPHPAWTAVGTTGLLSDTGVVEIQMIAYVPQATP